MITIIVISSAVVAMLLIIGMALLVVLSRLIAEDTLRDFDRYG